MVTTAILRTFCFVNSMAVFAASARSGNFNYEEEMEEE